MSQTGSQYERESSVGYYSYRQSQPDVDPDSVWVSPGESITVAGKEMPGGMIYVGKYLQPAGGYCGVEPSLINPELRTSFNYPDMQCCPKRFNMRQN